MDLSSLVIAVEKYVQAHLPGYIEELRQLCAIDSGTDHKPGLDETASYLAMRMRRLGMHVTTIEQSLAGNDVVGTIRGHGNGCIALLGHTDTVYPVGTAAERPLRREDNAIYAPGAIDMKGCILAAIYAIEALCLLGNRSFGELRFLCVSDEETSQRHSVNLIEQVCRGCQAVFVLEAARANGDIVSARKGTAWYTLIVRGHSAHAGVEPEKGHSAILELAHQIIQFQSLNGWLKGLTINAGVISGGTTPNVIPDYAQARFDLRYPDVHDRAHTEQRWREMLRQQYVPGVELLLTLEAYRDPMICTPESLKLVSQAQDIAHILGFSINHEFSGGTSDGRYASALEIPVLDGLGPIGGCDHSPDEYLLVDSVAPRAAMLAGLILRAYPNNP